MNKESKNIYIIDDVIIIHGYNTYLEYYHKHILPCGLMTICVGAHNESGRVCLNLRTVERGRHDATVS